ncbi:MAG TPA: hypothetical protein VN281_21765 [Verrucomicrobiae bacterium]|nr:hypothetical protein [Verrucomicrobiae bacterium]
MAVEGIGNLAQILTHQLRQQTLGSRAGASTQGTGNADNTAVTEDTFTPSAQNNFTQATAQDAGIFQVSQGALTAVTAKLLFAHANANGAPSGVSVQPASAANPNPGNAQPAVAALAGQAPPVKAVPATNVQQQIQFLNAALPALRLSKVEIQEIDRLAAQIQNFNPAAYTDLINQFEALAQHATRQDAANAAANASNPATEKTPVSTKANVAGSQV